MLSGVDLDPVLDTLLAVLQERLKASDKSGLQRQQGVFELCDDIVRWRNACRSGLNLAREGLLLHVCMRSAELGVKGSKFICKQPAVVVVLHFYGGQSLMSEGTRQGILSLTIRDKAVLYAAYMPFLQNGGLFVPTDKHYGIGDEVFMLLTLMDEPEKIPIAGRVVWITPAGAQGNRKAGIGVQFSEQDAAANAKIENHLGGALNSERQTHTM